MDKEVLNVVVRFGARVSVFVQYIFDSEGVKAVLQGKYTHHIPADAAHTYPPHLHPRLPLRTSLIIEHLYKTLIIHLFEAAPHGTIVADLDLAALANVRIMEV